MVRCFLMTDYCFYAITCMNGNLDQLDQNQEFSILALARFDAGLQMRSLKLRI